MQCGYWMMVFFFFVVHFTILLYHIAFLPLRRPCRSRKGDIFWLTEEKTK